MEGGIYTAEHIFDKISKRASEKGISINSLEKQAGISIGSVYKWNTVSPTIRNLSKVAEVLECTIDELLK
jgi:DNA-binding Xre family transcriptional regulator